MSVHATRHIRGLALDDSPGDLALLKRHLSQLETWQVETDCFDDPNDALKAFAPGRYDVILVDYRLGTMTGLELHEKLLELGNEAPVILLTGMSGEELVSVALGAGISDYLPKVSINPSSLERAIGNAVEKSRMQLALRQRQAALEESVRALRDRNEEIQSFYHTVAHELKTPLTGAREFVSIVLDGLAGTLTEQQVEYLEVAKKNCDQMVTCIDDMIDVSRFETGKLSLTLEPLSIEDPIQQAVSAWAGQAEQKGLEIEVDCPRDIPTVMGDDRRLFQVISNLLSNAVKFSEEGAVRITVTERQESGWVETSVTDTGRGISPWNQKRIFDRLTQTTEEDAAVSGGLGLGLSIARELVKAHGGTLTVNSTVGQGSTFTFTVPCAHLVATSAS